MTIDYERATQALPERGGKTCALQSDYGSRRDIAAHQETADGYSGLVLRIGGRHRIVVCAKGVQRIIQVRRGERLGQARWTGLRYCATRMALIAASRALCGPLDDPTLTILNRLPERLRGGQ